MRLVIFASLLAAGCSGANPSPIASDPPTKIVASDPSADAAAKTEAIDPPTVPPVAGASAPNDPPAVDSGAGAIKIAERNDSEAGTTALDADDPPDTVDASQFCACPDFGCGQNYGVTYTCDFLFTEPNGCFAGRTLVFQNSQYYSAIYCRDADGGLQTPVSCLGTLVQGPFAPGAPAYSNLTCDNSIKPDAG